MKIQVELPPQEPIRWLSDYYRQSLDFDNRSMLRLGVLKMTLHYAMRYVQNVHIWTGFSMNEGMHPDATTRS